MCIYVHVKIHIYICIKLGELEVHTSESGFVRKINSYVTE